MRRPFPWGPFVLILFLGLPGVGVLIAGLYQLNAQRQFLSEAREGTGQVAAIDFLRDGVDTAIYAVSIEYDEGAGRKQRFKIEAGLGVYQVGQAVDIAFIPGRPRESRLSSFSALWEHALIFTVVGLAWTGFAGLLLYVAVKK